MLFAGVVLKLVPLIVTLVPTGPDAGANEVMVGWANKFSENRTMREKRK
jgi:hypothetical protein